MSKIQIKIKKLNQAVTIPQYAKDGDAGLDLIATKIMWETDKDITYGTDIALEIPYGYVGFIFPRSSIRKYGLVLANSVGVIDSGYRGEVQISFKKTSQISHYNIGDKIAQLIILPYPQIELIEAEELSNTERGSDGFGSTGK